MRAWCAGGIDSRPLLRYPLAGPGGSGAAETCELRQVREEAAVSGSLWAPPGSLPGPFVFKRSRLPGSEGSLDAMPGRDRLFEEFQHRGQMKVFCPNEINVDGYITMHLDRVANQLGIDLRHGR